MEDVGAIGGAGARGLLTAADRRSATGGGQPPTHSAFRDPSREPDRYPHTQPTTARPRPRPVLASDGKPREDRLTIPALGLEGLRVRPEVPGPTVRGRARVGGCKTNEAMITLSTCRTPEDWAEGNRWSDRFGNPEHRIDKIGELVSIRAA